MRLTMQAVQLALAQAGAWASDSNVLLTIRVGDSVSNQKVQTNHIGHRAVLVASSVVTAAELRGGGSHLL